MLLMKMSDFCRKYKIAPHRFNRHKYAFVLQTKEGFQKPWVVINDHNVNMVAEILGNTGTRPKKARLTYEDYKKKYGLEVDHFQNVWHRLTLEEHEGRMLIPDTKRNYALLKHGRLIRKKI